MSNNIPESLKKAFANKTLIPLVGAGVSMSLMNRENKKLFPSWRELLKDAADKLISEGKQNYADAINAALGVENYLHAADYARQGLKGSLWNQFFRNVFDINRSDIDEGSLSLPKAIWSLSERVITLNYDKVLSFACHLPDDVKVLDNTRKDSLADFSRNTLGKPAVWHLHGNLDNLGKIILTSESYSKFYAENDSDYKAALSSLQSICSAANLIFIGCSLDDADLLQQLACQHNIFAGNVGPHYALVREVDRILIQTKLKDFPFIDVISFADFGQPLLDAIAAISASKHEVVVAPINEKIANVPASVLANSVNRIAILTANPIGENDDYRTSMKELEKLDCEITYYPLTIKSLNELDGFDYIFILSRLVKNNIVIEDEAMQSARSNFKNIEDNIGNSNTKGIFIFLDHTSREALNSLDISNDLTSLQLPVIIFPSLEKVQLDSLRFQYFKKRNIDYISEAIIVNKDKFQLGDLKGGRNIYKNTSKLSESIDKKNSEQYLGRRTDLQYLCREIVALQNVNEVLTIKGSGGSGKTATVKKIAVELSERFLFPEGVDFVDCEFIGDYSSFEKKVAASFNLENALDIPLEIRTKLNKQEKLIILDNVETLLHLPDTQQIKDFIYFVSDYASIVITTREILNLSCEKVIELSRYSSDDAYALFNKHFRREPKDLGEQRILRQDIVEELLDNNPLAIKLVASNLPTNKKMLELKQELEDDIFRKASADELNGLDSLSDINIERKKSLYASINFSYKNLDDSEKKAFEILSLFPDGIHMNALKIIAGDHKSEPRKSSNKLRKLKIQTPIITDPIIRNLENKSIIQVDNQIIKLQSIMGKFAELQLRKRKSIELVNYYQRASEFHIGIAKYLIKLRRTERSAHAARWFNQQQSNFLKSIDYLHQVKLPEDELLDYLNNIGSCTIDTTLVEAYLNVLSKCGIIKEKLKDADAKIYFDVIVLKMKYYLGHFSDAFSELSRLVTLEKLEQCVDKSTIDGRINDIAISIYGMEGEQFLELKYDIINNMAYPAYPHNLFQLGEIDLTLLNNYKSQFDNLEPKFALGLLDITDVEKNIAKCYEKDHLELMETYYLKAKFNLQNGKTIDAQEVIKLVTVNPYTLGLQQLMLAFSSERITEATELYEKALNNLIHIKYYYVEALLYYARYLHIQNMHPEFNKIYQEGYSLACKHYYRWLQYQFEDLIEKKALPYSSEDYPLPEKLDIKGYIQFLIKQNRGH
ncbi:MAG: hypothetical protein B0W54_14740 [Cellvibrio sp. 79]|nr:MAG: hypothetical protein B0W54_14740 [Cellvibrio sp. 79]